jgi:hypothetical protein
MAIREAARGCSKAESFPSVETPGYYMIGPTLSINYRFSRIGPIENQPVHNDKNAAEEKM